jgi:hypothetical protein
MLTMTSPEERKRQLGQHIRLLRDTRGITVEQGVAAAAELHGLKIHPNTWYNVEGGSGGAGKTYAAIELVLWLERGSCKRYVDDGGLMPEPIKDADEPRPATTTEMADALARLADESIVDEHDAAILRVIATKLRTQAQQSQPVDNRTRRASG